MKLTRWICGVWMVLFFLFLPFPMDYIPETGTFLTQLFLPLTKAIASVSEEILTNTSSFSDSIHLYVQSGVLILLAIPVGTILSKRKYDQEILSVINAIIALVLGFFLIKYGIEKLTRLQFPTPPPNILYTPAGQLDKDILFWSLMGTSKAYAWFMGSVEIIAGILVLIRKTRAIGALIGVGIFANILAINIGFDITVKVLAFSLLFASIYLVLPYLKNLILVLTNRETHKINEPKAEKIPGIWKRALKGIAIALVAFECILPILNRLENPPYNHELIGTFEATSKQAIMQDPEKPSIRRLHFHPHGYLIIESESGQFDSEKISISKMHSWYTFQLKGKSVSLLQEGEFWYLEWRDDPKSRLILKKSNNNSLPLLQDKFHWTVEGMIESETSEQ